MAFFEGADGNFYGACQSGGAFGLGTIFKIAPDGTFTVLYAFPSAKNAYGAVVPVNGYAPLSLIQGSDGNLYGTANGQTINAGSGVVSGGLFFQLTPAGAFSVVTIFSGTTDPISLKTYYPQGAQPVSVLQGDNGNFYLSMAIGPSAASSSPSSGGYDEVIPSGQVTVFYVFTTQKEGNTGAGSPLVEGSDGSMYGTAYTDSTPQGIAFQLSPSGLLTPLHQFTNPADGIAPPIPLLLGSDGNLYGAAFAGGSAASPNCASGCGTFFQLQPSGAFTVLHTFTGGIATAQTQAGLVGVDGAHPDPAIIQSQGGVFFGTTAGSAPQGVATNSSTVYSVALTNAIPAPVQLAFSVNGQTVTSVVPNTAVTLIWTVLNAFSATAQQCHASILGSPLGAGNWNGPQSGTRAGNVYTGATTITPSVGGIYTYVLNCGGVETGMTTLTVSGVTITTAMLPDGVVSVPYNATVQAIGGVTPYTWGTSGSLPAGLSIASTASFGAINITGTPSQFGKYQVAIAVQDSTNPPETGLQTYVVNIVSGLTLMGSLNNGTVGTAYNTTVTATGGLPPYKWALTSGKLPAGLTLNISSGVITGTPTAQSSYTFAITVADAEGTPATATQSYTVSTVAPPLTIVPGNWPICTVEVMCSGQYVATGGTPPYTWSIVPGKIFPPGLTFNSNGSFSGLPTQYNTLPAPIGNFGQSGLSVQVTDSSSPPLMVVDVSTLSIVSGLKIVSIPLPTATVGAPYQAPEPVATGGVPPYKWEIRSQTPQVLDEYGVSPDLGAIYAVASGPVTAGSFELIYTVTDSEAAPAATANMNATLTVVPTQVTSVTTLSASPGNAGIGMTVTLSAKVSATGSVPTGTVTFYNGGSVLGTGTLDATGNARLTTSFSAPGVYSLTATYAGAGSTVGSTSALLNETIVAVGVAGSISPSSLTIASGSSGTLTITVTPTGGYTGTVNISCGALPANVSCTFVPPSLTLTAGGGPATATLTIHTSAAQTATLSSPSDRIGIIYSEFLLWLPSSFTILGAFSQRNRKSSNACNLLLLVLLSIGLAGVGALAGCGHASSQDAKAGTYTIPVTLTLASGATQTASSTLIIQ